MFESDLAGPRSRRDGVGEAQKRRAGEQGEREASYHPPGSALAVSCASLMAALSSPFNDILHFQTPSIGGDWGRVGDGNGLGAVSWVKNGAATGTPTGGRKAVREAARNSSSGGNSSSSGNSSSGGGGAASSPPKQSRPAIPGQGGQVVAVGVVWGGWFGSSLGSADYSRHLVDGSHGEGLHPAAQLGGALRDTGYVDWGGGRSTREYSVRQAAGPADRAGPGSSVRRLREQESYLVSLFVVWGLANAQDS